MIDFHKGTVGKDYFSDRLYGCQECTAEYLASKEPLSACGRHRKNSAYAKGNSTARKINDEEAGPVAEMLAVCTQG